MNAGATTGATIAEVTTAPDLEDVRALCWDYRDFLLHNTEIDREITETFYPVPKYQALMADLATLHAHPKGIILLARDKAGAPVGCGMTHPLSDDVSEIKRVFVPETARGKGIAAEICKMLIAKARADGFAKIVLDTSKALHGAERLYQRLGFAACGPYQPIPSDILPELLFFEMDLRKRET